jgi:hypothetical protein
MKMLMKTVLVGVLVGTMACGAGNTVVQYKGIPDKHMRVEENPLPDRPDKEPIPPAEDYVYPVTQGDPAPADGVLLSPAKAARAKKWQIGYDEIRGLYEQDRQVWKQNRIIYEERLDLANQEIGRLQPSWWDQNKGTVAFIGGVVLGAFVTVGVAYGLDQTIGN